MENSLLSLKIVGFCFYCFMIVFDTFKSYARRWPHLTRANEAEGQLVATSHPSVRKPASDVALDPRGWWGGGSLVKILIGMLVSFFGVEIWPYVTFLGRWKAKLFFEDCENQFHFFLRSFKICVIFFFWFIKIYK